MLPWKQTTRIAIVGDVMLDEYLDGEVHRISPEAPVPVVQVTKEFCVLGGAGNSAANVSALGASAFLVSVIGEDQTGFDLTNILHSHDLMTPFFVVSKERLTTRKTRITSHTHQICRVDRETTAPLSNALQMELLHKVEQLFAEPISSFRPDALLLSDYGKGVLSYDVCRQIIDIAKTYETPVVVDPKGRDYTKYCGATLITPNYKEACEALKVDPYSNIKGETLGEQLRDLIGFPNVLVTLGDQGMVLVQGNKPSIHLPAIAHEVFDVSGAGDTVAAVMALGLGAGCSLEHAMHLANTAAAVAVSKTGTQPVKDYELIQALDAEKRGTLWNRVRSFFR